MLATIERYFGFLTESRGFLLVQTSEVPAMAWYRAGERTIVVSYDPFCDAAIDVHLEVKSTDERHLLADILAFEAIDAARRTDVRDPLAVDRELARAARLVAERCEEFLRDDLPAFRLRYREALLVKTTRAAAMKEFYEGDPARARWLFEALRSYWTDLDREHVARLRPSGSDKSLAHLRLSR